MSIVMPNLFKEEFDMTPHFICFKFILKMLKICQSRTELYAILPSLVGLVTNYTSRKYLAKFTK